MRDRLRQDRATLAEELSDRQAEAIREIVGTTDGVGMLEFLVVYGSVSRGEQAPGSDLDIYYETSDVAVDLERTDPDSRWHVFGAASGALLENLRLGDRFAFELVADALVVYDDGHFRDLLVAMNDEKLKPAEPEDEANAP